MTERTGRRLAAGLGAGLILLCGALMGRLSTPPCDDYGPMVNTPDGWRTQAGWNEIVQLRKEASDD